MTYTQHIKQKRKVYQDGILELSGGKVIHNFQILTEHILFVSGTSFFSSFHSLMTKNIVLMVVNLIVLGNKEKKTDPHDCSVSSNSIGNLKIVDIVVIFLSVI